MKRILASIFLCAIATAPRADTQFTPWIFNLQKQFDACINAPSDTPYITCQGVLYSSYTLRREIGYALDTCHSSNVDGCVQAFDNAGFPAKTLRISTLPPCEMLGDLNEIELTEIPGNSCIEHIAHTIERNGIPTSHNTDISCGINYIECAEIINKGTRYWQSAALLLHQEKMRAIPTSIDFEKNETTSHRYYSLRDRQYALQVELAQTNCNLLTVIPHWANPMDYQSCMGEAYAEIWAGLKNGSPD